VKLLLDEMFSREFALSLRARGHDVAAVLDDPTVPSATDPEVLARARRDDRALVTRDLRDYRILATRILGDGSIHAGLVLVSERAFRQRDPRTAGRLFLALLALLEAEPDIEGREYWLR
jgi:Domain of unknown function (DUF5615)